MRDYKKQNTSCKSNDERGKNCESCIVNHASVFLNEKGIALVMALILSAIVLAIITGLIYMITSSTQISGMQKRYKTALEAGIGGAEITYQFIAQRGDQVYTELLKNELSSLIPSITTPAGCTGIDISNMTYTEFEAKVRTSTTTWSGCDNTRTIIPNISTSYDMRFELGMNPKYTVYTKIVDTVWGNSEGQDPDLFPADGTAQRNPTKHMSIPWLYTIEVDAQNADNPSERAKLSILYQY